MTDDFGDLTQQAGSIVGTEAQKLREQLGDEEYERYADYVNQCQAASVDSTREHSQHTRMKAFGWWCGGVSALAVSSGFLAWALG